MNEPIQDAVVSGITDLPPTSATTHFAHPPNTATIAPKPDGVSSQRYSTSKAAKCGSVSVKIDTGLFHTD